MNPGQPNSDGNPPPLDVAEILRQLVGFTQNAPSTGDTAPVTGAVFGANAPINTQFSNLTWQQPLEQPQNQPTSKLEDHLRELQRITERATDPRRRPPPTVQS